MTQNYSFNWFFLYLVTYLYTDVHSVCLSGINLCSFDGRAVSSLHRVPEKVSESPLERTVPTAKHSQTAWQQIGFVETVG